MKHCEVVAAVIEQGGRFLCAQRGESKFPYTAYKFEFPGGKVEAGEEKHEALARELREEMDMQVTVSESDRLMTVEHAYPDFSVTMHAYLIKVPAVAFALKEHVSCAWLTVEELCRLDWAEADKPIVKHLEELFSP